jgi:hypothetical protein
MGTLFFVNKNCLYCLVKNDFEAKYNFAQMNFIG